jgi:hypothetical protein
LERFGTGDLEFLVLVSDRHATKTAPPRRRALREQRMVSALLITTPATKATPEKVSSLDGIQMLAAEANSVAVAAASMPSAIGALGVDTLCSTGGALPFSITNSATVSNTIDLRRSSRVGSWRVQDRQVQTPSAAAAKIGRRTRLSDGAVGMA